MGTPIGSYLRQQHLALLALVLITGGGTAVAVSIPRDSVTSQTVRNNTLKSSDLKDGQAVNGVDVVDNSLGGADLAELTGADIAELTGADIAEATLGQVPSALKTVIGGSGSYQGSDLGCDPESSAYVVCTTTSLTLPEPARLLVLGRIRAKTEPDADKASGSCRIGTTSGPLEDTLTYIRFHDDGEWHHQYENLPLLGMTAVMPVGTHTVGIDCNQFQGEGAVTYESPDIAVLAISAD
jgi:hypothetical protein